VVFCGVLHFFELGHGRFLAEINVNLHLLNGEGCGGSRRASIRKTDETGLSWQPNRLSVLLQEDNLYARYSAGARIPVRNYHPGLPLFVPSYHGVYTHARLLELFFGVSIPTDSAAQADSVSSGYEK
jgi:hypothetical protein